MMPTPPAQVLRCERKFEVRTAWTDGVQRQWLEQRVRCHPAMFRLAYPPRWVNNLYLDSAGLAAYQAALDGEAERCKTRVRWYHATFGLIERPQLEFKAKVGAVSRKRVYALAPWDLRPGFCAAEVHALVRRSELTAEVLAQVAALEIALYNRYHRSYWETPDGRFRLTIDTQMSGSRVNRLHNRLRAAYAERGVAVLELKYDTQCDDEAHTIADALQFRLTRHSKYVEGLTQAYRAPQGGLPL